MLHIGKIFCLTKDQARYIYKKVEPAGTVKVETIKQEIEDDRLDKENTDNEEEVDPYWSIILENIIVLQM